MRFRTGLSVLALVIASCGTAWSNNVPLVDAAQARDRGAVLEMLSQGVDVNIAAADGTTALHWAVHHNDAELAGRLILAGANVNARNDFGASPMSEAALVGDTAMIRKLLEAGADPDAPNPAGMTALMVLARNTNVEGARLLLERGADPNAAEQTRNQTALMWAAAQNQPEMVKLLLGYGADPNARTIVNVRERMVSAEPRASYQAAGGLTPMLYAAREGCAECARHLVEGGADIDLDDPEGVTPLIMAVWNTHFDTAAYLLAAGADPNKWDWWGRSPLYLAVDYNTIPRGGRPDRPSLDQTAPLELIEMLLEAGANPNLQLKLLPPFRNVGADRGVDAMLTIGATPLLRAAKGFDAPAVRLLLQYGALANLPNIDGITPTMAAAGLGSLDADTRGDFTSDDVQQRSIESLKLLLEAGGEINASITGPRGRIGQTPLHGAAFWGWNDVVQFLVDNGASLNAADRNGMTPLDAAMGRAGGNSRGGQRVDVFPETAELIERLGGRPGTRVSPAGGPRL